MAALTQTLTSLRHRPAGPHHREVHGVFAGAGDIFLGAVERVDQHEGIAGPCRKARHFLGDDVDVRHQSGYRLRQAFDQGTIKQRPLFHAVVHSHSRLGGWSGTVYQTRPLRAPCP